MLVLLITCLYAWRKRTQLRETQLDVNTDKMS